MAQNPLSSGWKNVSGPALGSSVITPSNTTDLPVDIRAITIGTAGTLAWIGANGGTYATASLPAGTYPLHARRILANGTTAAQLTGWV